MNSVVCYHCERPGHMVRDCPDKIKLCYNCSTVGHLARDCPEPQKKRLKPDSPKKSNSPDAIKNDKACFVCGSVDHLKQNCPKRNKQSEEKETENGNDDKKSVKEDKSDIDKKSCWECGKTGHIARECPNPSESFKRKSRPFSSFDGPDRRRGNRGDDTCFRCGEHGHFAKDCTGFRRPSSPQSPLNAEVFDLLSRALNKGKRDLCYVCGQPGHFARECSRNLPMGPAPFANMQQAPNGPFRGIGGGGGGDCGPNSFMAMQSLPQFNENLMVPEGLNVNNPCLTCGRTSHVTFDCPIAKLCYRCGMTNHIAKDCAGNSLMNRDRLMGPMDRFQGPGQGGMPFNSMNGEDRMKGNDERCFRCGGRGHKSFECSQEKACYRCGRRDHEARDCLDVNNTCYKCGKTGHMTYNCDSAPPGARMPPRNEEDSFGDTKCYRCGRNGHTARDCPQEKVCYKCNREGHIARDCPREEFSRDANRFRSSERGGPWIDF